MNIIFLDFDGVIKTMENYQPYSNLGIFKFNDRCMDNLKRILEAANAKIVISSNWRDHLSIMRAMFEKNGVDGKYIIDVTPCLAGSRGDEIQEWLNTRGKQLNRKGGKHKIEKFIILDDNDDMGHLRPHLIQTFYAEGITKQIADTAIEHLTLDKPSSKLRYISDEEQKKNTEFWKKKLEPSKKSENTLEAIELMKVPEKLIKEYGKDYTSLTYRHKFREETITIQDGDYSNTSRVIF